MDQRQGAPHDDTLAQPFLLGQWHVVPAADEVVRGERCIKLEPRLMRLLVELTRARGAVVRLDTLLDRVWAGLVVTPDSVYQSVAQLRRLLDPAPDGKSFIQTVPRKGYRLNPSVPARPALAPPEAAVPPGDCGLTIAVLPFETLGDSALQPMAALLHDLVITRLARDTRLNVIARGSVHAIDPRQSEVAIGQEVGAAFIARGRLAMQGNAARLTYALARGLDGAHVSGDAVEVDPAAWIDAADLLASRLARALQLDIASESARRVAPPADAAGALALQAWVELFTRPQTAHTNARAKQWAEQALAQNPAIASAWNCLAYAQWRAAQYGWEPGDRDATLAQALAHVRRALALDPRDPDAHYTHGLVLHFLRAPAAAEEAMRSCVALNPSYAPAYSILAFIRTARGHPEESAALHARAFAISPREPLRAIWHSGLAFACLALGDAAGALEQSQRGMAVNADFPFSYATGVVAAHRLGRQDLLPAWLAALAQCPAYARASRIEERVPGCSVAPFGPRFLADLRAAGLPP